MNDWLDVTALRRPEMAIDAMLGGSVNIMALGKPFIGNPDLVSGLRIHAPWFAVDGVALDGEGAHGSRTIRRFSRNS